MADAMLDETSLARECSDCVDEWLEWWLSKDEVTAEVIAEERIFESEESECPSSWADSSPRGDESP